MIKISLIAFISIHFIAAANGQDLLQTLICGSDSYSDLFKKDSQYISNEKIMNNKIRNYIIRENNKSSSVRKKNNREIKNNYNAVNLSTPVITIPVVFHIVNQDPLSITDQNIIDAVAELNKAFSHDGIYGTDSNGADTRIQFCLATRAPNGGKTNGINRIKSYYQDIDVDLESGMLGTLSTWDISKYANIWVVKSIQGEVPPTVFECGKWERMSYGGYASAGVGLVVSGLGTPLIAHEMGHYLSLLHTFAGTNCLNNDCTTDGDLVCDTPPDRSYKSSPCNSPENSCNTDTISGPFSKDVPDNISNFMDYGSPCPTVFTKGQGERMRAFLNIFNNGSLLSSDGCSNECPENLTASFNFYDNPYPVVGSNIEFKNTSTGGSSHEWSIDGAIVSSNYNYNKTFSNPGSFKISLITFNAAKTCYSKYEANVIVNCGVDARFSPNKRVIASSGGLYEDSVLFLNKTYGGDSFSWYVSDEKGGSEKIVSNQKDLNYKFTKSGNYKIRLIASKGSCISNSPIYNLRVEDPMLDGQIDIYDILCYKKDSIMVQFGIRNNGYDSIPPGILVNFYAKYAEENNPINAKPLSFTTPEIILGKCGKGYTFVFKKEFENLTSVTSIFDEENKLEEFNESNNKSERLYNKFKLSILPFDTTVLTNSTFKFRESRTPSINSTINWSVDNSLLSCNNCLSPIITTFRNTKVRAIAITQYGCMDTAFSNINVNPIDLSINNKEILCYKNDFMQISSQVCFNPGPDSLYKRIEIRYFDGDSSKSESKYLGSGWIEPTELNSSKCINIKHIVPNKSEKIIYSYVNSNLDIEETDLSNNSSSISYTPFSIRFNQSEIEVGRGIPIMLEAINRGDKATDIIWSPSNGLSCINCLTPTLTTNTNSILKISGSTPLFCTDSSFLQVNTFFQSHIALPNVFTPNGDGKNDIFYIIAGKDVKSIQLFQIYNRWGKKIFEKRNFKPNDPAFGWNGYYNGKLVDQGTYVYQITLELISGKFENYRGNITVLR